MKLFVLNLFLSCLLVIKPCQCTEEKSNGFLCPDTSETSLVTTVISGCKVYYTCKNAAVSKIFQCSESQILAGTTHVCQENPQCPGIDSIKESLNFPTVEESRDLDSDQSTPLEKDASENSGSTFMDTILRFIKCLAEVENIDDFFKTCIGTTLFQERPFMEIELSPKVFEVYAKMLNKSKSSDDVKYDPTWDTSFGKVLNGFIWYLAPQCEIVCNDVSKQPDHDTEDISEDKPPIHVEDPKLSFEDVSEPDQILAGDRVRRSPMTTFSLLRSILLNTRRQMRLPVPTVEPPKPTRETKLKLNDNSTLMSDVLVPIIQDIVNDEEALKNTTNLVRVVFEAVVPLATEILKASNESFDPDQKAILKIPREMVQSTIRKIYVDGYPILRSILGSKLQSILMLLSKNSRLLFRSWDQMESRLEPNVKELISRGFELYKKYCRMFRSSTKNFIHTYSLIEIQQDIESMYSLLPEVSKELLLKNWSVFQDASGITTESISKMLLDVPGIFEAINAIPIEHYIYFFFLFL